MARGQQVSKKEDRLKDGLIEIKVDMRRDTKEREQWMMQFSKHYAIKEEETMCMDAESRTKSTVKELTPNRRKTEDKDKKKNNTL